MRRPGYLHPSRTTQNPVEIWAGALNGGNPIIITQAYAPDAYLLPTLDARPLKGRAQILPYFQKLTQKSGLHVEFQHLERINPITWAGLYTFKWHGGQLPARFTFVASNRGIEHHHSSAMP
tara:strand:+ start:107 stop:469 length:363 start_codon:yes stop_codon:yes gene_type:complete